MIKGIDHFTPGTRWERQGFACLFVLWAATFFHLSFGTMIIVKCRSVYVVPLCVMLCHMCHAVSYHAHSIFKFHPLLMNWDFSSIRTVVFSIAIYDSSVMIKNKTKMFWHIQGQSTEYYCIKLAGYKRLQTGRKHRAWNCCYHSIEDNNSFIILCGELRKCKKVVFATMTHQMVYKVSFLDEPQGMTTYRRKG